MNDFLHSLRTGKDKRYDRNRGRHDTSHYRPGDRHVSNDRRKRGNYSKSNVAENAYVTIAKLLPQVKTLLETVITGRNDFLVMEERKTEAMESIARYLKKIAGDETDVHKSAQSQEETPDIPGDNIESGKMSDEPAAEEVTLIGRIQELRAQGISYDNIASTLEQDNIPTPSGRGKWRGQAVSKLLKTV